MAIQANQQSNQLVIVLLSLLSILNIVYSKKKVNTNLKNFVNFTQYDNSLTIFNIIFSFFVNILIALFVNNLGMNTIFNDTFENFIDKNCYLNIIINYLDLTLVFFLSEALVLVLEVKLFVFCFEGSFLILDDAV